MIMDWQLVLILATPVMLGIGTIIYLHIEDKKRNAI